MGEFKIVDFDKFCKKCKYEELSDDEGICLECLEKTVDMCLSKPIYWEEKE